jgi:hypothetical protein
MDLQNWIGARFLAPILNIEGGWEYWIQIDFPCWLDVSFGVQFDFRREVAGVATGGRLDWLINSQGVGGARTAVEIKAQTHKYLTATFLADIQRDINKLQTVGGGTNRLMLAAACDDAAATALTTQQFLNLFYLPNNVGAFFLKQV